MVKYKNCIKIKNILKILPCYKVVDAIKTVKYIDGFSTACQKAYWCHNSSFPYLAASKSCCCFHIPSYHPTT